MTPKPWWQSATIWVNVAGAVAAWLLENSDVLGSAGIDPAAQMAILAVANIVVRFKTRRPVTLTSS